MYEGVSMNRPVPLTTSFCDALPRIAVTKPVARHSSSVRRRLSRVACRSQWDAIKGQYTPGEKVDLPTQGQSAVAGIQLESRPDKPLSSDIDYLSELLAIQQNGPKDIGFFGTRNMGVTHQKLVEILSYALILTGNHIFTSGAVGTNKAVIKGALRAGKPEKLTVVLPQSISRQPSESQELLKQVTNVIEMPWNDHLSLFDASKLCNQNILTKVQQVICFVFHDSRLMLETCDEAKGMRKIVTLFYLD